MVSDRMVIGEGLARRAVPLPGQTRRDKVPPPRVAGVDQYAREKSSSRSEVKTTTRVSAKTLGLFLVLLLIATDLAALVDIPVLRQVLAFLFFTVVPGALILEILSIDSLSRAERAVFSVGLSVAFLMLGGLIINWAYFELGYGTPLAATSLLLSLSMMTLVLGVAAYARRQEAFLEAFRGKLFDGSDILLPATLLLILVLLLGILGALVVRFYESSLLSTIAVALIAIIVGLAAFDRLIPRRFYPIALFFIALALLLNRTLASAYLYDIDIHYEYFFSKVAEGAGHWSSDSLTSPLNAMLSTTFLPTIYSALLHVDAIWVFKICFIVIFALAPVGMYEALKKHHRIGEKHAFLSVLFFMSFFAFFNAMPWLPRQAIAELFLVLIILLMVDSRMSRGKRSILAIILTGSLIVSHYGVTYIWLFCILAVWLILLFRGVRSTTVLSPAAVVAFTASIVVPALLIWSYGLHLAWLFCVPLATLLLLREEIKRRWVLFIAIGGLTIAVGVPWYVISQHGISYLWLAALPLALFLYLITRVTNTASVASTTMVLLALVMALSWYMYASNGATLRALMDIGGNVSDALGSQVLSPASTDPDVARGLGSGVAEAGAWHGLGQVWVILTELLVGVGLVYAFWKRKEMEFQSEHFWFCVVSMGVILMFMVVPFLASSILMYRLYAILLLFLSPFCILGLQAILKEGAKLLKAPSLDSARSLSYALVIVLVPYLLFNSGLVFELTERVDNLRLSGPRLRQDFHWSYFATFPVPEQDVEACRWMSHKMSSDAVYVDESRRCEVVGYGMILSTKELTPETPADSQVYLGYQNVKEGQAIRNDTDRALGSVTYDLTELVVPLSERNRLYTNGGSEVYR